MIRRPSRPSGAAPTLRLAATATIALLLAAAPARAADLRFGYIDSSRIFQEYSVAKEAQLRFDRQVQSWQEEAAEKQRAVDKLRAEVRDQSPILSSAKRQEMEEALQKAISEYETFIQEVWGPQGRAARENDTSTQEIVRQVREVVDKLANDKGLSLVLDAASGIVLFADKSFDLTAEVLTELNTRATSGTAR
jgi:outer membrane protein